MYEIELTEEFSDWLEKLSDSKTQKIIIKRIRTMSLGTLGDVRSLNEGLFEAKIRYGPGYRLYFINRRQSLIVLFCGSDKSSQKEAIKKARKMAKEF